jgi:hypothetical protein
MAVTIRAREARMIDVNFMLNDLLLIGVSSVLFVATIVFDDEGGMSTRPFIASRT